MITGHVEGSHVILDVPFVLPEGTVVRVEPLIASDDSEISVEESLRLAEASGALDFWKESGEDVYTVNDGDPV